MNKVLNMFSLNVPEKYASTMYNTFRPIYIASRVFGYSSFSATITKPSLNKIYLTKLDHFIFVIHVLAYISCALYYSFAGIHDNMSSSKLLTNGTNAHIVLGCFGCCIIVVVQHHFRNYCWEIIENLNEFDVQLLPLDKAINHSKFKKSIEHYLKLWSLLFIAFSINAFAVSFNYSKLLPLLLVITTFSLINGTYGTVLTLYSFFIISLKVRFEAINDCLRDEGALLSRYNIIVCDSREKSAAKIIKLAQLYDKLTETIQQVNRRFSIQVMTMIASDFIFSVFSLYSLYRVWNSALKINYGDLSFATILMFWALYYNIFLLIVIWSGSSVRTEGKYTGVLIHRIINNCSDIHVIEKLSHFSQQIRHQLPTAKCNLFSFDWSLLLTMVGASTTYLMILIQFDSSLSDRDINVANITKY